MSLSHVIKHTKLTASATFIDPIVFQLYLPNLINNFCFRKPQKFIEHLIYWFVSQELTISHYISRHFSWRDAYLPPHVIGVPTIVYVGGNDSLVNAPEIHSYLKKNKVECVFFDGVDHAGFLVSNSVMDEIIGGITSLVDGSSEYYVKDVVQVSNKVCNDVVYEDEGVEFEEVEWVYGWFAQEFVKSIWVY